MDGPRREESVLGMGELEYSLYNVFPFCEAESDESHNLIGTCFRTLTE